MIKMRIGITYNPSVELFYSGLNQTALTLMKLCVDHDIYFIDIGCSDENWWSDYPLPDYPLPEMKIALMGLHNISGLDLLIDIDGTVLPEYRERIAQKSIVFLRNFIQFAELNNAVYPEKAYVPRDYKNVSEIWCWDILNPAETLDSVRGLFPCPIKTVPFVWSPSVAEHYSLNTADADATVTIHIAEKNDDTSSPIIPLVAIRELVSITDMKFIVHNIKDNRFLKENILPIQESGQLKFLNLNKSVGENLILATHDSAITTNLSFYTVSGHTDAMMLPKINYKGKTIVFMADLLPSAAHIPLPYVMAYDMFPLITLHEKKIFLTKAQQNGMVLFFEHDPLIECCNLQMTEKGIRVNETFKLSDL